MVQLHLKEASALKEAVRTFTVLTDSVYANKQLGSSGQLEVMTCECGTHGYDAKRKHEKDPGVNGSASNGKASGTKSRDARANGSSHDEAEELCGPDSNCINRLTYMECFDEFCCDETCANRRFQRHEHCKVDIFKAGKKGFGMRAMEDIREGAFIYEYTGEVLDEQRFQRRQQKYDREGVKHFYFMMLQKDEFIDATEKGSIARFCNHSCNPNAQIEKWVVGPKLRMGLFAKRDIQRGEEICFDYKVDRYGSKAQPCFCGEPNCSGFLGGRTQTGGTLLPPSVVEGLGLDSDTALSWPENALQKLKSFVNERGQDLESVLSNESEAAPANGPPQSGNESPNQQQQQQQQHPVGPHEQPQEPEQRRPSEPQPLRQHRSNESEDALEKPSPSRASLLNGAGRKKRSRSRNQTAELTALLDAPPSSLNDSSRSAQQQVFDMLPLNPLDSNQLPEFMRILMQAQDRGWLISLMLKRVLSSTDYHTKLNILRMHGYEIMATVLNRWRNAPEVVHVGLSVLQQWPTVTKNKISSSQIEAVISEIRDNSEGEIKENAAALLDEWGGLSMGYRIPRRKAKDSDSTTDNPVADSPALVDSPTRSPAETDGSSRVYANKNGSENGSAAAAKKEASQQPDDVPGRASKGPVLPLGWEMRISSSGKRYFYNKGTNTTSWEPPKDPREIEREERIRMKKAEEERARQDAIQKERQRERERQANEIQRVIEESMNQAMLGSGTKDQPTLAGDVSRSQSATPSSKSSTPVPKKKRASLEFAFAEFVPKFVFAYAKDLGHDRCKRHARDVVHILAEKERAKGTAPDNFEVTHSRRKKAKNFVQEYMAKVRARHQNKPKEEGQDLSSIGSPAKIRKVARS